MSFSFNTSEASITIEFVDWEPPVERWEEDGSFTATRILRCAWAERHTLVGQLRGTWLTVEGVSTRVLPDRYPGRERALARLVSASGWPAIMDKDSNSFPVFEWALINVTYSESALRWSSSGRNGVETSNRFEGDVEVLTKTIEDNSIFWNDANDAVAVEAAPSVTIPTLRWNLAISNVKVLNLPMLSMMGAVNETAIEDKYLPQGVKGVWVFAPETVRYDVPDMEEVLDENGDIRWSVTLQLNIIVAQAAYPADTSTWNHAFRPGRDAPEKMYTHATNRADSDRYRPYRTAELNNLLGEFL